MPALISKLSAAGLGPALANAFGNDTADNLSATGTNQATAYQTSTAVARFTTVAASTGCMLSQASQGDSQIIANAGANTLSVYPPTGHTINGAAANAAFTIGAGAWGYFDRISATAWLASSDDSANLSFLQSGSGALATDLQTRGRKVRYVTDYYANGTSGVAVDSTGVVDSAGGIQAAINAGAGVIIFPAGTYLIGSQLSVVLDGVRFELAGVTLKKGFSGNLCLVSAAQFAIDGHGTLDGQSQTYTGKGIVFSGGSSNPFFGPDIIFKAFADAHIEFGADAGKYANILCAFSPDAVQTDFLAVNVTVLDTAAASRKIIGSITVGGYHNLTGAQDTYIIGSGFKRVVVDSTSSITNITSCRWGNAGAAMTVSGSNTNLVGNDFSGNVTLDANWNGVFGHNVFTSGSLTNSAAGLNSVFHKSGSVITIGNTSYYANGSYRVLGDKITSCGDSDQTFSVGGNGPTMQYKNILGANRTVTLSTTGAVNGDWCLVTRTGGDSGGPWTVSVGGLKSLSQNQWALAKYDGSVWFLAEFGSL